ncbi:MAG: Co2+/Mg2+ efflux protein ApaG [Hyphomicrobiaceae bacterium]|nr:Co2+/Mg2+ efflux protein ApaG [Hyphomicrobiaceae bacterium]
MYEAVTRGIRVRVTPRFLDDQSAPDEGRYFWAYTVEISNGGETTVQLKTRQWLITDANGRRETVNGPGVVGKTPTLAPGQSFTYTSGCPLTTPSGIMSGSYQMQMPDGRMLDVTIPSFSLDSPYAQRSIN